APPRGAPLANGESTRAVAKFAVASSPTQSAIAATDSTSQRRRNGRMRSTDTRAWKPERSTAGSLALPLRVVGRAPSPVPMASMSPAVLRGGTLLRAHLDLALTVAGMADAATPDFTRVQDLSVRPEPRPPPGAAAGTRRAASAAPPGPPRPRRVSAGTRA